MSDTPPALPRVLIVDDSRIVRASIIKHLKGAYDFREEPDGEAGWQSLLLDPSIQVVISDIGMPKLDGFGLLERIRGSKVPRVQEIPIIIISGDEDDAARIKAKGLGATDFIAKGIGNVELLARLDALSRLAQTRRELEESREALAKQSTVDPGSGLATAGYLQHQGEQALALARRHNSELSVMVIDVDRFDELVARHGRQVSMLIVRKLSKILGTRVRREDTVAQQGESQFVVVSPSINLDACGAFANRLRQAISGLAMNYRGELIHISLTVGLANSVADKTATLPELIAVGQERLTIGRSAGGNQVVGSGGVVRSGGRARYAVGIEQALVMLRSDAADEVRAQLPDLLRDLIPLLRLAEQEYKLGLPIAAIEAKTVVVEAEAGAGST
jgi:diguanylate cyclase (GGDEF)-like protein